MENVRNVFKIFLFSVPPTISVLLDEKGSEVTGTVGPYNLGGTLILTCDILGGQSDSVGLRKPDLNTLYIMLALRNENLKV